MRTLPHADDVLNKHTLKVACQTCHIPVYAKVNPTKLSWDWSTAGRLKNGQPYEEKDASGTDVYMSIKGSFVWGTDAEARLHLVQRHGVALPARATRFDPSKPLKMNDLHGSYDDPDAKIFPVKIHRAKQIYDTENQYLIQPKLFSSKPGDGGYWTEFNWQRAAEEGMKQVGLPYSGNYGFARDGDVLADQPHGVARRTRRSPAASATPGARPPGRTRRLLHAGTRLQPVGGATSAAACSC